MKKRDLTILVIVFTVYSAVGQQIPLYNQYMMNKFAINPAAAGMYDYSPVFLTVRNQWIGMPGAPSTQSLSGHGSPFRKYENMGLGATIFNDKYGPIRRTGFSATYAYHLSLDKAGVPSFFGTAGKISFGLSVSGVSNVIEMDELDFYAPDVVDTKTTENNFIPDAGFGVCYYSSQIYAGISVGHLVTRKIDIGNSSVGNELNRHYLFNFGYVYNGNSLMKGLELEPSILVKSMERKSPMQVDVNVKAIYNENLWLGLSYRSKNAMVVMLGIKYDRFFLGYAFDYSFTSLSKSTAGSHEVVLGARLQYKPTKDDRVLF